MNINNISTKLIIISLIGLFAISCSKVQTTEMTKENQTKEGATAIENELVADGYDLISFFELKNAAKGNPKISLLIDGANYYFSNEENKKKFLKNADKYLPKYDEFCPVSLSKNLLIEGDAKHYVIYKDKLYFFYSKKYAEEFEEDPESYLKKASDNWEELKEESK